MGLAIEYDHKPYGGSIRTGKILTQEALYVKIVARNGVPSRNFITTPQIRRALTKASFPMEEEFGRIKFTYNKNTKTLEYTLFFPLPLEQEKFKDPIKVFAKKGIASILETRILKQALITFPETKFVSVFDPRAPMRRRIRALGFDHRERIRAEEFNTALRRRTALKIKQARAKRAINKKSLIKARR